MELGLLIHYQGVAFDGDVYSLKSVEFLHVAVKSVTAVPFVVETELSDAVGSESHCLLVYISYVMEHLLKCGILKHFLYVYGVPFFLHLHILCFAHGGNGVGNNGCLLPWRGAEHS